MGTIVVSSIDKREVLGRSVMVVAKITLSASYATGGDSISASQLGMSDLDTFVVSGSGGYVLQPASSYGKIQGFEAGVDAAALDEIGTGDQTSITGTIVAFGKGLGPSVA